MPADTNTHVGPQTGPLSSAELARLGASLGGWDHAALPAVVRRLSELCSARCAATLTGPVRLGAQRSSAHAERTDAPAGARPPLRVDGYVATLVERATQTPCAWLELEGDLARALVDLALGGTGDAAELGLVETLDPTREGVLLYLLASALSSVPQAALAIAALAPAHATPRPARVACAAQLTLDGRAYGAHLSVAPALLSVSASGVPSSVLQGVVPDWAQAAPCEVSVTLARGALDAGALAALEPGDVLIPCEVWADAGAWSEARLYCDAFTEPLATLCVQADAGAGGGLLARGPAPRAVAPRAPSDGVVAFSVDAARASVPLSDLSRWLAEERVPLPVDPAAPLTLFVAGQPVARGHLVRDQGDVGLCIERTLRPLQSSAGSPNTAA